MQNTQSPTVPSRKGRSKHKLTLREQILFRLNADQNKRQQLPAGFDQAGASLIFEFEGLNKNELERLFPEHFALWDNNKASIVCWNEEMENETTSLPHQYCVISVHVNERKIV